MKERLNKFIHSRLFIIILVVTLMCTTLLVGTYAWFTWSSTDNTTLVMSIGKLADVIFESGNDINGGLTPVFDYKSGLSTSFSVNNRDTSGTVINYDIKLNITTIANELISEDVKWVLEKNNVILSEGDFSTSSNGTTITLAKDFSFLDSISYTFYLYIDGNKENDQSMIGKNITGSIIVESVETNNATTVNLLNHIRTLYSSKNPTVITHAKDDGTNDTYYYSYQDGNKDWGLMNDGLKVSSDSSIGATTITDSTALTSGTEGNIRYFGPSDKVNNYIYFNCETYPSKNCELWRIIGIVDGKVKLIRNDSIGDYSWDNKNTITGAKTDHGSNNWSDARLMRLLNPGYENYIDKDNSGNDLTANNSLYWNSGSGACYYGQNNATKTCNFTSTGLKNDETRNMISETTWYLGGHWSASVYPNDTYKYERTNKIGTTNNPYTIDAKIGLMYASDYGYGTNLTMCSKNLWNYDSSAISYACRANNWLFNSAYQWLITPYSSDSHNVWHVFSTGIVDSGNFARFAKGVNPVLYLDSELNIFSVGDGSKASPYRIEPPLTLINFIKKQYTSGNQELITQTTSNDSYYYSYQDDSKTWGLMNDGLKIDTSLDPTTTGLATTVTSTEALTSGTKGNIRYFGPSDKVNNYIYFNCSDYSNQSDSTCEKWRIIGIVDGKVKIIRNESIGDLAWDQDKNQDSSLTTYSNNWKTSSLQEFLNGLYYNRGTIESHPYYSGSNGSTTTTLNLKTIGITEATRNNNLISETTWYLGGFSTSEIYPNQIYAYERTNKIGTTIYSTNDFTIQKNIGLMYPSDYGYGTDLTKCSQNLYNYNNSADTYACRANNWLFNSSTPWLITPSSSYSSRAWLVNWSSFVNDGTYVYYAFGVRPVLYLDSELTIESEGDGSSTNPYRIIVR